MISAKIIADSVNEAGNRLTTFELTYPRFIHGEVMTHRVFSRNAMSSRAVPVKRMLAQVWSSPTMPVHWGKNQPGMQAKAELAGWRLWGVQALWGLSGKLNCAVAWAMDKLGAHKQIVNRRLEPDQWMKTILTATEWDNFYELRDHEDAQPEFQVLARKMREAHEASEPNLLKEGEWHLPYMTGEEEVACAVFGNGADDSYLQKASAARCARVSYLTHDGQVPHMSKDLALFERLAGSRPLHASPLEHQCTPGTSNCGNFVGWTQFRKLWEKQV